MEGKICICLNDDYIKSTCICNSYIYPKMFSSQGRRLPTLPPSCTPLVVHIVPCRVFAPCRSNAFTGSRNCSFPSLVLTVTRSDGYKYRFRNLPREIGPPERKSINQNNNLKRISSSAASRCKHIGTDEINSVSYWQ